MQRVNAYSAYVSKVIDLRGDLLNGLEFVKWRELVKSDSRVFIKPNFSFPYHKEGITTSPEFLRTLMGIVRGRAHRAMLGESDGGNRLFSADASLRGHDMGRICAENGVELINLSKSTSDFVEGVIQGRKVKVRLPKLLLDGVDCLISVPVLKVHYMTGVSLGIKNLWGCDPDTMRNVRHKDLSCKLALMMKLLSPKLEVVDGTYALDLHGARFGRTRKTDLIMLSDNLVAGDSLGAAVMGMSLRNAEHILISEKEGLGTTDLGQVRVNRDWREFQMKFTVNRTLVDNLTILLSKSETLSGILMDSALTPLVRVMARFLRTSEEKKVVREVREFQSDIR